MSKFQSARIIPADFICSLPDSRKSYRLIQLKNGILTLLISDPLHETAGGALCVRAGSFLDPDDIIGLAHLCEHAIFLGNKQFPLPQSFFELITKYNGSTDAYTTGEQTVFQFEVPIISGIVTEESIYTEVLQNFSAMFKHPSFNHRLCCKEVNAVNDEHLLNKGCLDKILHHALRILTNKSHPFSRFGTGNSITLNKPNLSKHLSSYFNENYISSKITLVLKGTYSLNLLQKNAIHHFDTIQKLRLKVTSSHKLSNSETCDLVQFDSNFISPNSSSPLDKKTPLNSSHAASSTFEENRYKLPDPFTEFYKLLHIEDDNETMLRIFFSYKASIEFIDFFEKVWCSILGDESEGSLGDYLLTTMKYTTSIFSHVVNLTSQDRILVVDITPSFSGKTKCHLIISIILNYISDRLFQVSDDLTRYIIELHRILKINFYYQNSNKFTMEEAAILAERLQYLKKLNIRNFLQGFQNIDYSQVSGSLIKKFTSTSKYVLSHFNIISFGNSKSCIEKLIVPLPSHPRIDPHYQFLYTIHNLRQIERAPSTSIVPLPNEFIGKINSDLETTTNQYDKMYQTSSISSRQSPVLVNFSKHYEIWFKREYDISFSSLIFVTFSIQCLPLETSVKTHMAILILCHLLGKSMCSKFYPAEALGYQWALFANLNGIPSISLSVSGLSFNFNCIFESMVKHMDLFFNSKVITYREFMDVRISVRHELESMQSAAGIGQAYKGSLIFLEELFWSLEERLDALELIEVDDLYVQAKCMLGPLKYTRILVSGDCDNTYCNLICSIINNISHHEDTFDINIDLSEPKSHVIAENKNYIFQAASSNKNDPMNTVFYYIQIGPKSESRFRVIAQLIANLFAISANKELRGNRMVGYAVLSGVRISRTIIGIYIALMSGSHQNIDIYNEIEAYILKLETTVWKMSTEEFESVVLNSFKLSENHENASLPSNYFFTTPPCKSSTNFETDLECGLLQQKSWESIFNKTYTFNTLKEKNCDANFAKRLTKNEFMNYFAKYVSSKGMQRSTLLVFITSNISYDDKVTKIKSQVETQLQNSNLNIPDVILDQIIRSSKLDYSEIFEKVSQYFVDKSPMKYIYKPLRFIMNRQRRSGSESDSIEWESLKSTDSSSFRISDEYSIKLIIIDSIEQFRQECRSITDKHSQYQRLNKIYGDRWTNEEMVNCDSTSSNFEQF